MQSYDGFRYPPNNFSEKPETYSDTARNLRQIGITHAIPVARSGCEENHTRFAYIARLLRRYAETVIRQ